MKSETSIKISIVGDDLALGNMVARQIFHGIKSALENGEIYVLGCPGGRSPRSTYQALSKLVADSQLSIAHLHIAMMDEYVLQHPDGTFSNVDSTNHFSCMRFAHEEIWKVLNVGLPETMRIPLNQVLLPDARDPQEYERTLTRLGVDCFLLASGATDGHIAFNGIGAPRDATTRVTALSIETRTDNLQTFPQFSAIEQVPSFGVTVGPKTIASLSKSVIMILQGNHKSRAFQEIKNVTSYNSRWPATIVSECRNAQIVADSAAASA